MTIRERRLAMILGTVVVLGVLYQLVSALALAPVRRLEGQIVSGERTVQQLRSRLTAAHKDEKTWKRFAGRTIGMESAQAQATVWLDNQIWDLLERSGMASITVTQVPSRRVKKTRLLSVPFTVKADGTLQAVTKFLHDFYTWPFHIKITSLDISQKGRLGADQVRLDAKIEALILPTGKDLPEARTAELDPDKRPLPHRKLQGEGMNAYAMIGQRNIFSGQEPSRPPEPVQRTTPVVRRRNRQEVPVPPPPPTPGRVHTMVQALLTYPGKEEVITFNTQAQQRETFSIGERLDGDSKLIAIHPYGAIAQDAGIYYLYPLSRTLAERERIEQSTHPLLWNWLRPKVETPGPLDQPGGLPVPDPAPGGEDPTSQIWRLLDGSSELTEPEPTEWQIPRGTEYADLDHAACTSTP